MLTRRQFLLTAAALPLLPNAAQALTAGTEYNIVSPPLATQDPKRIEVLELFWYGCPHCYALEPELSPWIKTLPKNVYFRRVPAVFLQTAHWIPLARAYYAAEVLGLTDKLHHSFFDAIHLSGQNLNDRATLLNFVASQHVNRKQFEQALDSPEVNARIANSQRISAASGAQGVPALVVDGKYQTSVGQTGSAENLIAALNELIGLAQRDKKR